MLASELFLGLTIFLGRAEHPAILTNSESPPKNAVGLGKDERTSVTETLFTNLINSAKQNEFTK